MINETRVRKKEAHGGNRGLGTLKTLDVLNLSNLKNFDNCAQQSSKLIWTPFFKLITNKKESMMLNTKQIHEIERLKLILRLSHIDNRRIVFENGKPRLREFTFAERAEVNRLRSQLTPVS